MGNDTYISFGNLTYDGTEKPCDRYQQFSEQSQQTETASIKKRYQLLACFSGGLLRPTFPFSKAKAVFARCRYRSRRTTKTTIS